LLSASSPEYAEQQSRKEDHDEDEEQDLGDFRRARRDPAEAEKGRDERNDEENDSVTEHEASHGDRLVIRFACGLDTVAAFAHRSCRAFVQGGAVRSVKATRVPKQGIAFSLVKAKTPQTRGNRVIAALDARCVNARRRLWG
jgi:hypothetical protein